MAQDYKSVPTLLKHCTVAIYKEGKLPGSDKDRFLAAWRIARSQLTKYGYLAHGSEDGPVTNIKFTHKGAAKTRPHNHEGLKKNKLFDSMSYLLEEHDNPKHAESPVQSSVPTAQKALGPPPANKTQSKQTQFYESLKKKAAKALGIKKAAAKKIKVAKVKRAKRG
jgi:hypothetical protein